MFNGTYIYVYIYVYKEKGHTYSFGSINKIL